MRTCVVALEKRPRRVATTARPFKTGRCSPKTGVVGCRVYCETTPVREPARGLRVGVPAVVAVPGTPELWSDLPVAALRSAEDETC